MEQELSFYIKKFKNGDKSAFKDVYNQSYKAVFFHACKILKNEHDAHDVLQSVYIKLYKKANQITDDTKLISWLFTVTENECKNLMRMQKRAPSSIDEESDSPERQCDFSSDEENPMEIADNEEFNKEIKDILSGLSAEQQNVIIMYYYKQMSIPEISYSLNCPEGTIKSRLVYARKNMKRLIEKYEQENRVKLHSASIIWLLADFNINYLTDTTAKAAATVAATAIAVTVTAQSLPYNMPMPSHIRPQEDTSHSAEASADSSKENIKLGVTEENEEIIVTTASAPYEVKIQAPKPKAEKPLAEPVPVAVKPDKVKASHKKDLLPELLKKKPSHEEKGIETKQGKAPELPLPEKPLKENQEAEIISTDKKVKPDKAEIKTPLLDKKPELPTEEPPLPDIIPIEIPESKTLPLEEAPTRVIEEPSIAIQR